MVSSYRLLKLSIALFMSFSVALSIYITFKDFSYVYLKLLKMESYSYLLASIPIVIAILYKLVIDEFEIEGLNVLRLVVSMTLYLLSMLLYVIGDISDEFFFELKALSAICLFWSSLVLLYRPKNLTISFLSMIAPLLLIPIPKCFVDYISSALARILTPAISTLTCIETIKRNGMVFLVLRDSIGTEYLLEATQIYGNIVFSVLSLAPLIAYFTLRSRSSLVRKTIYVGLVLAVAMAMVFVGNLVRTVLVIELAKQVNFDVALRFFRYTSSAIYIAMATFLAILITLRLSSLLHINTSISSTSSTVKTKLMKPSSTFYEAIVIYIVLLITYSTLVPQISSIVLDQFVTPISDPSSLVNGHAVQLSMYNVIHSIPKPEINDVLGASLIRNIAFEYNGTQFMGYIEIANTPTKFIKWYACAVLQGFNVERVWTEVSRIVIRHMIISRSNTKLLLSYTIYKLVEPENTRYLRLSIMTTITDGDIHKGIENTRKVLTKVNIMDSTIGSRFDILDVLTISTNISMVLSIALLILYYFKDFSSKFKISRPLFWWR